MSDDKRRIRHLEAALDAATREIAGYRDDLYESVTTRDGWYDTGEDREAVERLDRLIAESRAALVGECRERLADNRGHLTVAGKFRSDWAGRFDDNVVPVKIGGLVDDLLWDIADRYGRNGQPVFAADVKDALLNAGYRGQGSSSAVSARSVIEAARNARDVIERVDQRCLAADGNVPPTREEITDQEMRDIYWPIKRALEVLENQ